MKSYSYQIKENKENHAAARIEGVDASFKDLAQVCGRMRNLDTTRAIELLEDFAIGARPVMFKSHNKRLGHRRELGGRKGRYPKKAAAIVLNLVKSAVANATIKGMIEPFVIVHLSANKKQNYPRARSKGRWSRADYETARVEVVIREKEIKKKEAKKEQPKKEEVKKPEAKVEKKEVPKNDVKKPETKVEKKAEKPAAPKKEAKTEAKKPTKTKGEQ